MLTRIHTPSGPATIVRDANGTWSWSALVDGAPLGFNGLPSLAEAVTSARNTLGPPSEIEDAPA